MALAMPIGAARLAALAAEGRLLQFVCEIKREGVDISATLCISLCSPDCIISNFKLESGVQSLRIPVGFNLGSREARTGDIWSFSIEASNFC